MMHYPVNIGQSVAEILRLLAALKASEVEGHLTPANWNPGDKMLIVPSDNRLDSLLQRQGANDDATWYHRYKQVNNDEK